MECEINQYYYGINENKDRLPTPTENIYEIGDEEEKTSTGSTKSLPSPKSSPVVLRAPPKIPTPEEEEELYEAFDEKEDVVSQVSSSSSSSKTQRPPIEPPTSADQNHRQFLEKMR